MAAKKAYKINKRRDGRYEVISRSTGKNLNGDAKLEVLVAEGLVKAVVKKKEEAPAEEAAAEAPAEEAAAE